MAITCCDFDACVKAMADETHQQILRHLGRRVMCLSELVELLTVQQPTVSHHLAVLRKANLVVSRRVGRRTYYQVNSQCVAECCIRIQDKFRTSSGTVNRSL